MTTEEQVRKAIALILQEPNIPVCDWDIGQCILANWKVNLVDQILNLKYPSGQPMIAILDEKQELPKPTSLPFYRNPGELMVSRGGMDIQKTQLMVYGRTQQDMVKDGWRKCL